MSTIWDKKPNFGDYGSVGWEEYLDELNRWLENVKAHQRDLDQTIINQKALIDSLRSNVDMLRNAIQAIEGLRKTLQDDHAFATSSKGAQVIKKLKEIMWVRVDV